jgi:hypothetical protein
MPVWEAGVEAACNAGATPKRTGSLDGGRKIFAEFDVPSSEGFYSTFTLIDSYDGTTGHYGGGGFGRVFCANQIAAMRRYDGFASIRHSASIEHLTAIMHGEIAEAIAHGMSLRELYDKAKELHLSREAAMAAFDALFPSAPDDAGKRASTIAENRRHEARIASTLDVNNEGASLATFWNAATFLVDRDAAGRARKMRGNSTRDGSMMLGTMGRRLNQIQETIQAMVEVIRPDGTVEALEVSEALEQGAAPSQVGSVLLESMLDD